LASGHDLKTAMTKRKEPLLKLIQGIRAVPSAGVMLALALTAPAPAQTTQTLIGPHLAAASNFGHGWQPDIYREALALPVRDFRDIIYWNQVERREGEYLFDDLTTSYPARLAQDGAVMSLTVNWGNDLYDDGATPHSDAGRAALGRFVLAALEAYPAITAVEIGNEFNGKGFVRGPIEEMGTGERAVYYARLLAAVDDALEAAGNQTPILGGAAHSIPGGYLWPLFEAGGGDHLDALVLHPYSTPVEQLQRQIAVLRMGGGVGDVPLQITEFGSKDPGTAAEDFLKMYCAMALSGVERAAWYPLNDRGDGYVPLVDPVTGPTRAGRAYALIQEYLSGLPVVDASPDPFTYACQFGSGALVVWGEPRSFTLPGQDIQILDAVGDPVARDGLRLSMEQPLLILSGAVLELGDEGVLGPHGLLADSYHQFGYPAPGAHRAPGDPFRRFARRNGERLVLGTRPGQEAAGTIWTPYRGNRFLLPVRLSADAMVIGGNAEAPVEIVHRYRPEQDEVLTAESRWAVGRRSTDGVVLVVEHNGTPLVEAVVTTQQLISIADLTLKAGDFLDFILRPGVEASGDVASYRIILRSDTD
jgi:hypothetical protein